MDTLTLPLNLIEQMRAHVQDCLPNEACGLIGGVNGIGSLVLPIPNIASSPSEFYMHPVALLQALRTFEFQALDPIAIYHSHPFGPPMPSQTDLERFQYPGSAYAIWAPTPGGDWQLSIFFIENGQFSKIRLKSS